MYSVSELENEPIGEMTDQVLRARKWVCRNAERSLRVEVWVAFWNDHASCAVSCKSVSNWEHRHAGRPDVADKIHDLVSDQ